MISRKSILSIIQSKIETPRPEKRALPYITLSYAQSVDGSIAYRLGRPLPLSGKESLRMTHCMRSFHDGILVGIGTILADNPRLTVRYTNGNSPQPIIADSRLRLPLETNAVRSPVRPPWIVTSEDADPARERVLKDNGVTVIRVRTDTDGFLNLTGLLRALRKRGIGSLMVEGGASIITSFLKHRLPDQIVLTLAPVLIGGMQAVWPLQLDYSNPPRLLNTDFARFGPDLVMRADVAWHGEA
jgi:GTP cyclohydrolase II